MNIKENIKIFSSFRQIINALDIMINIIRVLAIVLLAVQAFLVISKGGKSI